MPSFDKSELLTARGPFGRNEFRRSTKNHHPESYMCARGGVPNETVDGQTGQKFLQAGEVMAKITSGADAGNIGCFQAGATDGRQTLANIVGINGTFLPWQLNHRDVEVAVHYDVAVVQAWCFERDAAGARIPLTNATRDAISAAAATKLIGFS